jgi:hypothetical protein
MSARKKKQDRTARGYWRPRLKASHPSLADAVADGKISTRKARIAAGWLEDDPADVLLWRVWRRATKIEKDRFLAKAGLALGPPGGMLKIGTRGVASRVAAPGTPLSVVDSDGYLSPDARRAIRSVMDSGKLGPGQFAKKHLGLSVFDITLGEATAGRGRIRNPKMIRALEAWLAATPRA